MRKTPTARPSASEQITRDLKRNARKQYGAEEKIRLVLDGLRAKDSLAELCRREVIAQSLCKRESYQLSGACGRLPAARQWQVFAASDLLSEQIVRS